MYRVYIDVIFAVNLFMDLAVLAMLNRLFSYRADLKHMIRGAVLGAVWPVSWLCSRDSLLLQMFGTYVAVGSLMAVTASWDPKQERTDPGSRRDLSNIRSLRRCYAAAF